MPHKREALAALGRPGAKGVALIDQAPTQTKTCIPHKIGQEVNREKRITE